MKEAVDESPWPRSGASAAVLTTGRVKPMFGQVTSTVTIRVEVTWPNMGFTPQVVNRAALAPERGQGLSSTASFIAVAVNDYKGVPSAGRTVTVSSASETRSGFTDASGCAV